MLGLRLLDPTLGLVKPQEYGVVLLPPVNVSNCRLLNIVIKVSILSHEVHNIAVIDCGNAPDILNGEVTFNGTTVGSTATYSCNTGFEIVGKSSRSCQTSGTWSGTTPTCGRKQPCIFSQKQNAVITRLHD